MARTRRTGVSKRASKAKASREEPALPPILTRPDGYYWEVEPGELRGPFATRAEAEADRLAGGAVEDEFSDVEGLHEAESELGVSEWIDPDTGVPAEDNVPRLEDH